MQISLKRLFLLMALLLSLALTSTPAQAAGLFGGPSGSAVFVGEVQSYGDYELKADACATFVDKLADALRQQGIAVSGRADLTNEEGRHDAIGSGDEAAKLSEIHMDAIVHGHQFDRGYTAAKLAHYADMTMGRAYFHQEDRLAAWKKSTQTYRLSPEKQRTAAAIAGKYGAKYLLFVNLKDFDVRLKHSIFATHTERETKGKKLSASLDYYLVNAQTGRVYEKHIENKKTAQMINFGLGKTGKGMDVDTLLGEVMETSAKDIAVDIKKKGLDEVKSDGTAQQ
ncbi:hypothetical protein [Mitsuokella multacida]|uniref:MurNAc-LAA domain-containing protein n=1 Tax=Mitsuokella multacida DSM 20544 TaxID=500635 RepID=C9KNZ6_9FIRM|nr:hypothetical protein [Mitsuokella multacida]EEX68367.1 hypothetical protein MITSMUL_04950 [Mitsuokella multacida DSM 20544]